MSWIVDHEANVESDLSAFHRIDDPMTISAERYFRLAIRLTAYSGVMAAIAYEETKHERETASAPHSAGAPYSAPSTPRRIDDGAALAMLAADGDIEYAKGTR